MDCDRIRREHIADEYRAGRLSPEDAEAYEVHYFACDRCFEDLQLRDRIARHLAAEGSVLFAPEIAAQEAERAREAGERRTVIRRRVPARGLRPWFAPLRPAWVGAAAAVAAVAVVLLLVGTHDRAARWQGLLTPTAYPYSASELRGGPGLPEFDAGMTHYDQGRYHEAAELLQRSIAAGAGDADVRFYLGVSLLMTKDFRGAARALEQAVRLVPSSDPYRWYAAQAHLGCGRVEEAELELRQLASGNGRFSGAARNLLQSISEARPR